MPCQDLSVMGNNIGLVEILVYPTTCFYWTYAVLFFSLFVLLSLFLYNKERENFPKPDMISSIGTSATAVLFLSLIGTLIKTSDNIPMVQRDIFMFIFVIWIILVAIWFFKRE